MSRRSARTFSVAVAVGVVVVLAVVAGWAASPWGPRTSAAQPAGPAVFASGASGGLSHRYALALAESSPRGRLGTIQALVTAGSWENLDRLARGEADFALATADVVEEYLNTGPGGSIRAVARLYDSYVHLLVPTGDEVHRLADLRGGRVAVGALGSGDALVADRILAAAGIDPAKDITRLELEPGAAVAALARRQIDAFLMVDGISAPRLEEATGVRLVDLADVAHTLLGSPACPDPACAIYRVGSMPASTYPTLAVAITTVTVPTFLLTTTRVDDDVVGELAGLVFESTPRIAASVPAIRQVDRRAAIFTGTVPLHDGARAYYRAAKVAT